MGIKIRIGKRKKENTVDNEQDEIIKRLDEHIKWIKENQKNLKKKN